MVTVLLCVIVILLLFAMGPNLIADFAIIAAGLGVFALLIGAYAFLMIIGWGRVITFFLTD